MTQTLVRAAYDTFRVEKRTGTHADVFAAVGLADLLADQVGDTRVWVVEEDAAFQVKLDVSLSEDALNRLRVAPGYPYLRAKAVDKVPTAIVDCLDYETERNKSKQYQEAREALYAATRKGLAQDPDLLAMLQQSAPREDWRLAQVMYLLTNHASPNRLQERLASNPTECQHQVAAALRAMAEGKSTPLDWKLDSVQLFNPVAAKGYARLKPDSTNRNDSTKDQWTDPFVEWLRYRGYFRIACPYFLGSKGEHIRVYTPVPARVTLAVLKSAAVDLRRAGLRGGAPKADALAVIHLARFLVGGSEEGQAAKAAGAEDLLGFSLADQTPADVIGGVAITHYQSLGNARAVAQIANLAVPGWFEIRSAADAAEWLEILDEHRRVVRGLDDSHSDEIGLLVGYRRFLERRGPTALDALLDFMGTYGPFLVRAWDAKRRVRAFRTTHFRRLVKSMSSEFAAIVADPGFEAVAQAVRRATVQAQFLRSNGAKDIREIRYDLLPDLRRARSVPQSKLFVEVVSDFIAKYNAENARRRELGKRSPANVHTDDFARFLGLVDTHGAEVVGALLCAYGTCVEPREADAAGTGDDADAPPETNSAETTESEG